MDGTMRERPEGSGVWELRVAIGRDPNSGRYRQKSQTFRGTKTQAKRALRELIAEVDDGAHTGSDASLSHLLDRWLKQSGPDLSPTTVRRYEGIIAHQIGPALGKVKLRRLKPHDLDELYQRLREQGLSTATIRQVHAVIHRALAQARRWGWVAANVADLASPPRVQAPEVFAPDPAQVRRLLAAAEALDPEWATFLFLSAATGARRGELCALRWSRVDWETRELMISKAIVSARGGHQEKGTKTHQARRIALDPGTMEVLRRHRMAMAGRTEEGDVAQSAFLFSDDLDGARPWHPDTPTRKFAALRRDTGVVGVRLHDLRHFVATRLLGAGMDVGTVADRLGHRDASVTLTVYRHFLEANDRQAAEVMGALISAREEADVEVSRRSAAMVEGLRTSTGLSSHPKK